MPQMMPLNWMFLMLLNWIFFMLNTFFYFYSFDLSSIVFSMNWMSSFMVMPFMVCIETISNIIRLSTLAARLSANMFAGHLLLTLLGNIGPLLNFLLTLLIMSQLLLIISEMAVAIIQTYVFANLSSLYTSEVNYE